MFPHLWSRKRDHSINLPVNVYLWTLIIMLLRCDSPQTLQRSSGFPTRTWHQQSSLQLLTLSNRPLWWHCASAQLHCVYKGSSMLSSDFILGLCVRLSVYASKLLSGKSLNRGGGVAFFLISFILFFPMLGLIFSSWHIPQVFLQYIFIHVFPWQNASYLKQPY